MVHYYRLELEVIGPVLTKSSLPGEPGLDAVALRDPDGALLLNGKHLEGRAKHAAYDLADLSGDTTLNLELWAKQAFGPDNPDTEEKRAQWEPQRGDITFEDLRCCSKNEINNPLPAGRDFRLQIDEKRGTGEDRMLAVFERAAAHGELLTFGGLVRMAVTGNTSKEDHAANLLRCLRWITSVGGEAGIGYGVLRGVRLQPCPTPLGAEGDPSAGSASVDIGITFTAPFCVAAPQLSQNIYEGLDTVPGNAIAGAIMRALQDVQPGHSVPCCPTLKLWFDKLRFRHAFPTNSASLARPMIVPLSWAYVEGHGQDGKDLERQFVEAALTPQPALFQLPGSVDLHAPKFVHDWKPKDETAAATLLKLTEVKRDLRTYTQIDRSTGVAMDEKLYSYELVRPEGLTWRSSLDLSVIEDPNTRKKLLEELKQLLNESPLLFGKTSARATLALTTGSAPALPKTLDAKPDLWIVLLLTPALLLDASSLVGAGREKLRSAYEELWSNVGSDPPNTKTGPLKLERYFTGQSLVGGNYLYRRFQDVTHKDYFPYLLTDAGSVFVLSSRPEDNAKAQSALQEVLNKGLPLPQWAKERFAREIQNVRLEGDDWRNCPFLPQNGYGEIAVNRQEQLHRLPEKLKIDAPSFPTVDV